MLRAINSLGAFQTQWCFTRRQSESPVRRDFSGLEYFAPARSMSRGLALVIWRPLEIKGTYLQPIST